MDIALPCLGIARFASTCQHDDGGVTQRNRSILQGTIKAMIEHPGHAG